MLLVSVGVSKGPYTSVVILKVSYVDLLWLKGPVQ